MNCVFDFGGVPSLKDAKWLWVKLGGSVTNPPQTGEVLFEHPLVGRVRANNRRKDCSRELITKLRRLIKLVGNDSDSKGVA